MVIIGYQGDSDRKNLAGPRMWCSYRLLQPQSGVDEFGFLSSRLQKLRAGSGLMDGYVDGSENCVFQCLLSTSVWY